MGTNYRWGHWVSVDMVTPLQTSLSLLHVLALNMNTSQGEITQQCRRLTMEIFSLFKNPPTIWASVFIITLFTFTLLYAPWSPHTSIWFSSTWPQSTHTQIDFCSQPVIFWFFQWTKDLKQLFLFTFIEELLCVFVVCLFSIQRKKGYEKCIKVKKFIWFYMNHETYCFQSKFPWR